MNNYNSPIITCNVFEIDFNSGEMCILSNFPLKSSCCLSNNPYCLILEDYEIIHSILALRLVRVKHTL